MTDLNNQTTTVDLNLDISGSSEELSVLPEQDDLVDLADLPTKEKPALSPAAVDNRTAQYQFLMPDENSADIKDRILKGEEEVLQSRIKQEDTIETNKAQKEVLEATINSGQATPQDIQFLAQRPPEKSSEEAFTDKLANTLASFVFSQNPDGPASDLAAPQDVSERDVVSSLDIVGNAAKRSLTLQRLSEDHKARVVDQQGFGFDSVTTDFLEGFVPALARWRIHDIDQSPYPTRFLLGSSKVDQRLFLLTLPPKQFAETVTAAYEELAGENLQQAGDFLSSIAAANGVNDNFDNAGSVLDLVDIVPIKFAGKMIAKTGSKIVTGKTAVNVAAKKTPEKVADDIAAVVADPDTKFEDILTVAGNEDASLRIKTENRLNRLVEQTGGDDNIERLKDLFDSMPAYVSPVGFNRAPSADQAAQANRLIPIIEKMQDVALDATVGGNRATRNTPIVSDALFDAAKLEMQRLYNMPDNAIVDLIPDVTAATGTDRISIKLGRTDGSGFKTPNEARNSAKRTYYLNDQDFTIETVGERSHIIVTKDVPEKLEDAWEALKIDTLNKTPEDFRSLASGLFFGASEFASKQNLRNFTGVSHMSERAIENLAIEFNKTGLSRKEWKRVESIFNSGAAKVDSDARQGKFFTLNELHDEYFKNFNRIPTDKEAEAYYKIVALSDTDLILRNLKMSREKIAQGVQEVNMPNATDEWFEARAVERLPYKRGESFKVVEYSSDSKTGTIHPREKLLDGDIREALDKGEYKIYQVLKPDGRKDDGTRALRSMTGNDDIVEFVITKTPLDTRAINFKQFANNPGGHQQYKHRHYFKQVRVHTESDGRRVVDEDYTIFNVKSKEEGQFLTKWLEAARKAYNDKDLAALAKIADEHLPWTPDKLKQKFDDGTFATDTPFGWTTSGQRIVDRDDSVRKLLGDNVHDPRKGASLYNDIDKKFAGERDFRLDKFIYKGSENKPDLDVGNAEVINAAQAIDQGFSQVAREFAYGDAEISAVRGWLAQYSEVLEATTEEILNSPMKVFSEQKYLPRPDAQLERIAKNNHRYIEKFLGNRQTLTSRAIDGINERLARLDFDTKGSKINAIVPSWQIPMVNDPFTLFRTAAYQLNLGFWNPYQAWLQAQGMVVVGAVEPRQALNAGAATKISNTLFASNLNPAHVKHADDMIVNLSKSVPGMDFKPGEFKQGFDFLEKSGWRIIGREVGNLDDAFTQTVIQRAGSKILQHGRTPFNWGERWTRQTAYWAAYKRWLKDNPNGKFDKSAQSDVLVKANDYALNMTREANANWQEGFASTVTQFSSFHLRLFEAYAGKSKTKLNPEGRFTRAQKTRLAATHMALYGVGPGLAGAAAIPWAAGAAVTNTIAGTESTLNLESDFKELLRSFNLPADDAAVKFATQGAIGLLVEAATGSRSAIGSQSGPGGLPLLEEILNQEFDLTTLLGPGGNEVLDLIKSADPLLDATLSVVTDRPTPSALRIAESIGRNVSTTNNLLNGLLALNTMKLRSKTDGRVIADNLSTAESIMLMFGIKPERAIEQFELYALEKIRGKHKKAASKKIGKLVRLAWEASSTEEQDKLFDEAWFKMESWFQPDEIYRVYSNILRQEVGVDSLTKARQKNLKANPGRDANVFDEN